MNKLKIGIVLAILFSVLLTSCSEEKPVDVATESPTLVSTVVPTVEVETAPPPSEIPATETVAPTVLPENTKVPTPDDTSSLLLWDDMVEKDAILWHEADGWTNGNPFGVGWRADHVEISDGGLILRLDNQPCTDDKAQCSGKDYASGEYRTNDFYHYGCVEGYLKAAQGDGIVTSLFVYTGPSDSNPHDEIDIEILGKDTTKMQVNYFSDGVGGHEVLIDLGFDAAQEFHVYSFEWLPNEILWRVDGKVVHTEKRDNIPATPGRVMMNLWSGVGVDSWLNTFVYPDEPIYAEYDWISISESGCTLQE